MREDQEATKQSCRGLAAWSVEVPEKPSIFVKLEVYLSYKSKPPKNMQHIYSRLTPYSVIF